MRSVLLHPGKIPMPLIGLGTFKVQGYDTVNLSLDSALLAGYSSIDTAAVYKNEEDIGKALKVLLPKYNLSRSDIFITSKLGPKDHGGGKCREACLKSISALQCDYLDLYLIHWPGAQGMKPDDPRHPHLRLDSWRDMESLYDEGKVKAIGVSNYTLAHLKELLSHCRIPPSVLQTEYHPHLVRDDLVQFCRAHQIHFQAYSSLGTSTDNQLIEDEVIKKIAGKYEKSVPQILLRWAVQQDIGVLPKSINPIHIQENATIFDFEISTPDMESITQLDKSHHYCWNSHHVT